MAGYMQYENPGAAFSGGMENYLMQRQLAQRQAQQDQLAVKREADAARMREEEIQARKEDRELRRQESAARIGEKKLADTEKTVSQMLPGDIPSSDLLRDIQQVAPGVAAQQFPKTTQDQGPTPEGVPLDASAQQRPFVGNRVDREATAKRERGAQVAQQLSRVEPGSKEERAILLQSEVAEGGNPAAAVLRLGGQPKPEKFNFDTYVQRMYPGVPPEQITAAQIAKARAAWGAEGRAPVNVNVSPMKGGELDVDAMAQAAGLTPQALEFVAKDVAQTGHQPPIGRTKEGKALYTAIINRAAQYNKDTGQFDLKKGGPPASMAAAGAEYAGEKKTLNELMPALESVKAFSGAAKDNRKLLDKFLGKVPDTGTTFGNWMSRGVATQFGSEDMARFKVLRQSLQTEYARLVTQARLTGAPLSDSSRKEFETILDPNAPIPAVTAALDALQAESDNREKNYQERIDAIKGRLEGSSKKSSGRTYYDADGNPIKGKE